MIQKTRDMLRNKISALKSRVKRKREQFESTQEIGSLNSQFAIFVNLVQEELVGPKGSKYAFKLKQRIDKALGTKLMVDKPSSLTESALLFLRIEHKKDE